MDRHNAPAVSSSRVGASPTGSPSQPHSTNGAVAVRTTQEPNSRSSRVPANPSVASGKKSFKAESPRKKPIPQPSKAAETKLQLSNDQLLSLFKNEFEAIRTLITCKICYGLMYEPFTSSCGHTYCYNCFCKSWPQTGAKCCPECRTTLRNNPAPSYLVRELTNLFIQRRELLPEDETVEQHVESQKEHRDIVQKDKTSPKGLFRGHFARANIANVFDHFDRSSNLCPRCILEVDNETGRCPQCQLRLEDYLEEEFLSDEEAFSYHGFSEPDTMSEDPDFDDMDDGFDGVIPNHDYDVPFGYPPEEDEMDDLDEISAISNLVHYGANAVALSGFGTGMEGPLSSPRRASHSASGSRRYSSSVLSEYPETEMGVVHEEDEDEDEDSSMSGVTDDNATTGAESPQSMHSARSTPSSVATGQSSASSASRRRRRADSNTPTPSMSQPSRRRRLSSRQSTPFYAMESENMQADHDTEEEGEEEENDREVTTTGCEPNDSRNGMRAGGSLTPTADQPFPTTRPRSRASGSRPLTGRNLRSRGSTISMNTSHYEDNDADDDGSGPDMAASIISVRSASRQRRPRTVSTDVNDSDEGGVELDSDDDVMIGRNINMRPVDERIREVLTRQRPFDENRQVPHGLHELRLLNRTPLARPRTSNRNRAAAASNSPATPSTNSLTSRRFHYDSSPITTASANRAPLNYRDFVGQDIITRPDSRVSINRPPSTNGRRASLNNTANNMSPGIATRYTWSGVSGNNPFRVRPNQPTRTLREQSSNATIRPSISSHRLRSSSSRGNVHATPTSPQRIQRSQTEYIDQRQLPRALNHTPSLMHLPQSVLPQTSAMPRSQSHVASAVGTNSSANEARLRELGMDHEERIHQRMEQAREQLRVSRRTNTWNGTNHHVQHHHIPHTNSTPTAHGMNITRPSANPFSRGAVAQLAMPPPIQNSQRDNSQTSNASASVPGSNMFSHVTTGPTTLLGTGPLGGINRRRSIRGLAPSSNLPSMGPAGGSGTARTRTPQSVQLNSRMNSANGRTHARFAHDGQNV